MAVNVDDIKAQLMQAVDNDSLVLPTLPEIALQVREAANDPNTDIPRLHDLIANDTALSARVVQVANSPLVRGTFAFHDLHAALSRLGINYSCNLVLGLAMEQMFQATSEVIDDRLREVWSHSTEVAAIANVLCQHYTRLEPDKATLAGLTHLIGVLPVLTYLEENEAELLESGHDQLDLVVDAIAPELGTRILDSWHFHPSLAAVPSAHLDFARNSEEVDYVDIVIVARLQSYGYKLADGSDLNWQDVPAVAKLGLAVESEDLELSDHSQEIDEALQVFR